MYKVFRRILFMLSPESAHAFVVFFMRATGAIPGLSFAARKIFAPSRLMSKRKVFGLTFDNPLGFAAGFDKNARIFNRLGDWGFAFVEIGTVTPEAQAGNPKPRCFRLKKDKALINRMGFNNDGLQTIVARLKRARKRRIIVGGNIGKNTAVANADAVNDYLAAFRGLYEHVDYLTVNVSCPNVSNLCSLQNRDELETLLRALTNERNSRPDYKPVLVKISPDLSDGQIDDTLELIAATGIDGIVAVNTTTSREGLATPRSETDRIGAGGLSGKPLTERSLNIVRYIVRRTEGKLPVIAVGGIMTPDDALAALDAGASLVQLYTGYIYSGPTLVRNILKKLSG
ncbi:MAG: quinone-dependent dihydroorotate dehydrogenase [Prevotellaceae bacterium]|jgi:dihydroorotate dehydrogenase|nr:quinone-dependent dihydroorotate dehydrogenase [Prevotellaceae bacterium]